jgi:hypothetical protein
LRPITGRPEPLYYRARHKLKGEVFYETLPDVLRALFGKSPPLPTAARTEREIDKPTAEG